jgi:hypothetical protein
MKLNYLDAAWEQEYIDMGMKRLKERVIIFMPTLSFLLQLIFLVVPGV